jgi:hypothetical protein
MKIFSSTIFALLFLLLSAENTFAQFNLLNPNVPVVKRAARPTGTRFTETRDPSSIPETAYVFQLSLPVGAGTYDGKPACQESAIRRQPVLLDSEQLSLFDMLIYDYRDTTQVQKAAHWELPTVPYIEGDLVNPYRDYNPQQNWARFFDIHCLPTRIHYPMIDGVRYEEYREGGRAWDLNE